MRNGYEEGKFKEGIVMKANELMIGDLLKWKEQPGFNDEDRNMVLRVKNIFDDAIKIDGRFELYHISLFEPIPLTPEILEKNGFKKFDFYDIEGQHQWSWWLDTLTSVSLWCRELNDDPKDGWMIRIDGTLAMCCHKVEYVHELQQTLRICGVDKEIEL